MSKFIVGDHVVVSAPGHDMDGARGVVAYIGSWTIGVSFHGEVHGFMSPELTHAGLIA